MGALFLIGIVFAYQRSFWTDEMVRLQQSQIGLWLGLKSLFAEPSPFAPGEIVLNWITKMIFGWWLPDEIWARLPGIAWAVGSLWMSFRIAEKREFAALPYFVFFSVSLLTVSVQMRPYGSLIFAGAMATDLILEGETPARDTFRDRLCWFAIFFTHLYGICLIGLACLLTQRIARGVAALIYTALILMICTIQVAQPGPMPGVFKLLLIIPFAVGNPHHASFILAPLSAIGILGWLAKPTERARTLKLLVILVLATVSPVLIDVSYRYFFAPRQVVGGIVPFLAFCALGVHLLLEKLPSQPVRRAALALIALSTLILPWTISILMKEPPVTDQPMHRFREIAQNFVQTGAQSIVLLDPCNLGAFAHYLDRAKGFGSSTRVDDEVEGIAIHRICWKDGPCLSAPSNLKYCWIKPGEIANDPVVRLLSSPSLKADRIVYEVSEFPNIPEAANTQLVRAW